MRKVEVVRCVHCRGLTHELLSPVKRKTWWQLLPVYWLWMISPRAILHYAIIALMTWLLIKAAAFAFLLMWVPVLVFSTYILVVLRQVAYGHEGPPRVLELSFLDIYIFGFRMLLVGGVLYLANLGIQYLHTGYFSWTIDTALREAKPWAFVIASGILAPALLVLAAIGRSFLAVLNPVGWFSMMLRLRLQYFLACGILVAYDAWLPKLIAPLFELGVLNISAMAVIYFVLGMLFPVFAANLLGRMVFENRQALGLGKVKEEYQPVFPEARPMGRLPQSAPWSERGDRAG